MTDAPSGGAGRAARYPARMVENALKEWAVTVEALLAGDEVVILRKGGIGEKRFELPHPSFFLFPTYLHQRPELVVPEARARYADALAPREEEPSELPLRAWADLHDAFPIDGPEGLEALAGQHILSADYAAERLRWRRTQPLWAAVLRVHRVLDPPVLSVLPEHGGCVSWVGLSEGLAPGATEPVLGDEAFARAAGRVEDALAAVGAGR